MALAEDSDESEDDVGVAAFFRREFGDDSDSEPEERACRITDKAGGAEEERHNAPERERGGDDRRPSAAAAAMEGEDATCLAHSEFASPLLDAPIHIVQQREKGIGFQLWPAATFLCRFLETQLSQDPERRVFGLSEVGPCR